MMNVVARFYTKEGSSPLVTLPVYGLRPSMTNKDLANKLKTLLAENSVGLTVTNTDHTVNGRVSLFSRSIDRALSLKDLRPFQEFKTPLIYEAKAKSHARFHRLEIVVNRFGELKYLQNVDCEYTATNVKINLQLTVNHHSINDIRELRYITIALNKHFNYERDVRSIAQSIYQKLRLLYGECNINHRSTSTLNEVAFTFNGNAVSENDPRTIKFTFL